MSEQTSGNPARPAVSRTAAATEKRMRASEEKAAERLRKRGWVCVDPETAAGIPAGALAAVKR